MRKPPCPTRRRATESGPRRFERICRLPLAITLTASVGLAQPPGVSDRGSVRDTITVRESTLYVRLLGPRGPVHGVDPDRFHVLLDGHELDVIAFEELDFEPTARGPGRENEPRSAPLPTAEAASTTSRLAGRSILIVLDSLFTPREYMLDAVRAARDSLDALGEGDQAAVAVLAGEAALVQPFTKDRALLLSALELLEASFEADAQQTQAAWRRFAELRRESPESKQWFGLRGALALGSDIGRALSALPDPTFATRESFRFEEDDGIGDFDTAEQEAVSSVVQAAASSTEAFADLVRLLADVPGPRYALLLARGMPNFTSVILDGLGSGDPRTSRTGAGSSLLASYQSLAYVLEGHGFVVQAVDVTGVGSRGLATGFSTVDVGPRPELDSVQIAAVPDLALRGGLSGDGSDSLFFLAEETGGELYDNFNKLETAMRKAYDASSHHYRIVVSLPNDPTFFEKRRRQTLNVRVDGIGARVRVTSSLAADWALPRALRREDPLDAVRAELLGAPPTATMRPGDARLGALRQRVEGAPRLHRAVVLLDVSTEALAARLGGAETRLTAHAIALPLDRVPGAGGEFLDLAAGSISWNVAEDSRQRLLFAADLLVPCEGARIRVRLADADQRPSWILERDLGEACDGPPGWFVPLRDESAFFALEEDLDITDPERNPVELGGVQNPALRVVATAGEVLDLLVHAEGADRELLEGGRLAFRDLASGNQRVLPFEVRSAAGRHGTWRAALPLELDPGVYEVTLAGIRSEGSAVIAVLP